MPPVGLLMGKVDFSQLYISLDGNSYENMAALDKAGAPAIKYGVFVNDAISFLILGFVMFMMIKVYTKMKNEKTPTPAEPTTKVCGECAMEIPLAAKKCGHCGNTNV
jgi:large conductance mechanosensitive channel